MITFPNAKINLGLHVLRKRDDGFHDIETVFFPIEMHDSLEVILSKEKTSFKQYGPALPEGENLCMKALNLLKQDFDIPPIDMHLLKHIPAGAGLGGGSSDAAYTLIMLNELFKLGISSAEMESRAARLGSDCAFFIRNKPLLAGGRGEVFEEINLDLSGYRIEEIKPDIHISTPEAFGIITPVANRFSLRDIIQKPIHVWKDHLVNDFEKPIFEKFPKIRKLKESFYDQGAIYSSMSGSGSAVYGIFSKNTAN